jgi:hypothetical protein
VKTSTSTTNLEKNVRLQNENKKGILMKAMGFLKSVSRHMIVMTLLMLPVIGCSTTETFNDILSSTTPSDWYTGDGLIKNAYKPHLFVTLNLDNLQTDLAKGQGEYLTSVTELLNVPPQQQTEFFALLQQHYPELVQQKDHASVTKTLMTLSKSFRAAQDA